MNDSSFLDSTFETIPIGSQAEILEKLEYLNNYSEHIVGPIKIRKNFTWGHNTRPRIKEYINHHRWRKKRGDMKSLFDHEARIRASFSEKSYRDKIVGLDMLLNRLRCRGAKWAHDDEEKEKLIVDAKKRYISEIEDVCKFYDLTPQFEVIPRRFDSNSGSLGDALIPYLEILAKDEKQTNNFYCIRFEENQEVCLCFDIKDDMEIFSVHDTEPLHKFSHGKIIVVISFTYKCLAKRLLNVSSRYDTPSIYTFYKAEREDIWLRHPFITTVNNIHNIYNDQKWVWHPNGACFGSFLIHTNVSRFELTKMMHSLKMWNKTFRIGVTNPINHLGSSWYGFMEDASDKLKLHGAAFYPQQCYNLVRRTINYSNDLIRDGDEDDKKLANKMLDKFDKICSDCEDRCLKESISSLSYNCGRHIGKVNPNETVVNVEEVTETEESIEEVEESMRLWVSANQ